MTATYQPGTDLLETTTLGGGGGVETTYSYDGFGDLAGILYEAANVPLYEVLYSRDTFGQVETKTEVRPGGTTLRCYAYDASDRLAAVYDAADSNGCTGSQLEAYTYDVNGNRASLTNSAGTVPAVDIVTDQQDRLQQHGDFTYTYNEDGQMETRTQTSTGDVWAYTYDAVGNLLEVDPPGAVAPTITYVTDPRNRKVGKRENGVLVQGLLYGDQLNPIAELDGSGAAVSRFVYGTSDHVPDSMVRGGVTYRFVTDHLGSVVGVYNLGSGAVVQTREYDAYGRIVSEATTPGFSQPFGFAGGLWDEDTGLVRFGARDYRPEVGSWAAKDPLRFGAGDASLYGYCLGEPVNLRDASGLRPLTRREEAFLRGYFGDALDYSDIDLVGTPLGRARVGFLVNRIMMPYSAFGDGFKELDLSNISVCAAFVHEAFHIWQRQNQGDSVWPESLIAKWDLSDAYALYDSTAHGPLEMYGLFTGMNVEGQAEQFENYVRRKEAGLDVDAYSKVAECVLQGRC